jgi:integrase
MATRVAKGIYRDEYRFDVRATANGVTHFASYPLDTKLATMKNWQESERATIRRKRPTIQKGTFAADVHTYLARPDVKGRPGYRNRDFQLTWWVARLGTKRRHTIKTADVQDGLDVLALAGKSPGYITLFRTSLVSLWSKLDGKQGYCPAKDTPRPDPRKRPIRAIPEATLQAILAALPQPYCPTSARILVMAETGLPPQILRGIRPEDVDLVNARVTVPPRHKGDGVDGRILPLTHSAVAAFRIWLDTGADGPFNGSGLNVAFKTAAAKVGIHGVTVYALRHTWLTRALRLTNGNLEAVQGLALHANKATTEWYTRGAVPGIMADAITAMNGNLVEDSSSHTKH